MIPKKNILIIVVVFNIIIGIGLQYHGAQLISHNDKKPGYFFMAFGLIILFINAVLALWKMKK